MVSQPSPNKRFPGSFFGKRAKPSSRGTNPLQLDPLENRTTPTLGWNSPWLSIPEPTAEISHIAPVNPHEPLDLVGEAGEADLEGPSDADLLDEDAWEDEDFSVEEDQDLSLEGEAGLALEEATEAEPEWSAPSILVDMRRPSRLEGTEVAQAVNPSLKLELGRFGTITVGARSFGTSDPVFSNGSTRTSQFLIRPGLVSPMQNMQNMQELQNMQNPVPEKAPARSSGQLAAWGVVMASGAAHLATNLPAKRRLTVESGPEY